MPLAGLTPADVAVIRKLIRESQPPKSSKPGTRRTRREGGGGGGFRLSDGIGFTDGSGGGVGGTGPDTSEAGQGGGGSGFELPKFGSYGFGGGGGALAIVTGPLAGTALPDTSNLPFEGNCIEGILGPAGITENAALLVTVVDGNIVVVTDEDCNPSILDVLNPSPDDFNITGSFLVGGEVVRGYFIMPQTFIEGYVESQFQSVGHDPGQQIRWQEDGECD